MRSPTRAAHPFRTLPDLEGVYRFRKLVGGCPAWYALNDDGEMLDFQVIRAGMDETHVVAELVRLVLGPRAHIPAIKLVRDLPAGASMDAGAFVRLLKFPPRLS